MTAKIQRSKMTSSSRVRRAAHIICLAALLSITGIAAHAEELSCNPACLKLVNEGISLSVAGKANEALHSYVDAASADPQSSLPYSKIAQLYLLASQHTKPENVEDYRQKAESAAREALSLNSIDPVALTILRSLQDGERLTEYVPLQAAEERVAAGENLFALKKYEEAKREYEKAIALDPKYARAYVYLGDSYYSMQQFVEAEKYFRKATEIDPLLSSGWRYLADTLKNEGKTDELREVILSSIAAVPNEMQNWLRMEIVMKNSGISMTKFKLVRKASYNTKTKSLNIDPSVMDKTGEDKTGSDKPRDLPIWLVYGMWQSGQANADKPSSPFEAELGAWNAAMTVTAESIKDGEFKSNDPALADMYRFYKAGQLKPAIFLLMYREDYRPDFEAWKKANPDAIKNFIDTWHVMPQQS